MRYKEIDINWTPEKLNSYLQKNYGYSLWHFSLSLAMNFHSWIDKRNVKMKESGDYSLSYVNFWKKRIHELKNLKKKNVETLKNLLDRKLPQIDKWEIPRALIDKKISPQHRRYIEIMFDLPPYFQVIDNLTDIMDNLLKSQTMKGASIKRTNVLSIIWHYFIRDKSKNVTHIANILALFEWFRDKFEEIDFYKAFNLEIEQLNNKKLQKLFYRYRRSTDKRNKQLVDEIEYGKKLIKTSTIGSCIIDFTKDNKNRYRFAKFQSETERKMMKPISPLVIFPKEQVLIVKDI